MFRRLFTLLSALSLLLCVAVVVLWVRSYWTAEAFRWATAEGGRRAVGSNAGSLALGRQALAPSISRITTPHGYGYHTWPAGRGDSLRPLWSFLGFRYTALTSFGVTVETVEVPYWALAAASAACPLVLLYFRRLRPRRRRRLGLCLSCGYDLRATPDRCPECGNASSAGVKA
jgi:hypothetical protein